MAFPVPLPPQLLAKALELNLNPADVEEHFIRGPGKGGQKRNKSSNAVQLTHKPTGVAVRCFHDRHLSRNREAAWKLLILKLEEQVKGEESELAREHHRVRRQKQRRTSRAKEKMLQEKHDRGEIKEQRGPVDADEVE